MWLSIEEQGDTLVLYKLVQSGFRYPPLEILAKKEIRYLGFKAQVKRWCPEEFGKRNGRSSKVSLTNKWPSKGANI